MKLNKQMSSFNIFLNYKKEHMKMKSLFLIIKRKFKIHSNLVKKCNLLTQVLFKKTRVPEFLTRPTFNFDGLHTCICTSNKLVMQK